MGTTFPSLPIAILSVYVSTFAVALPSLFAVSSFTGGPGATPSDTSLISRSIFMAMVYAF